MEEYEFLSLISEGAYGSVWKAKKRGHDNVVAIKRMKCVSESQEDLELAMREVRLLQVCLNHPHIVQLYEAYQSRKSGRLYLVFEYLPYTLRNLINNSRGHLPPEVPARIMYQLLQALEHLHRNKIMHRDIKPVNILLSEEGDAKLCDFGLARLQDAATDVNFTTYVVTRWYRPVEVLLGDKYSSAVDIWSLGCVFVELLRGKPLFPGRSHHEQLWLIMQAMGSLTKHQQELYDNDSQFACFKPPSSSELKCLHTIIEGLDSQALEVVAGCLQIDPERRMSAEDLLKLPYFAMERARDRRSSGGPKSRVQEQQTTSYEGRTATLENAGPTELAGAHDDSSYEQHMDVEGRISSASQASSSGEVDFHTHDDHCSPDARNSASRSGRHNIDKGSMLLSGTARAKSCTALKPTAAKYTEDYSMDDSAELPAFVEQSRRHSTGPTALGRPTPTKDVSLRMALSSKLSASSSSGTLRRISVTEQENALTGKTRSVSIPQLTLNSSLSFTGDRKRFDGVQFLPPLRSNPNPLEPRSSKGVSFVDTPGAVEHLEPRGIRGTNLQPRPPSRSSGTAPILRQGRSRAMSVGQYTESK